MRILDRIALNRLISIITSFILSLAKIFGTEKRTDDTVPKPPKLRFPYINKLKDKIIGK
jgi:hypothetical protein